MVSLRLRELLECNVKLRFSTVTVAYYNSDRGGLVLFMVNRIAHRFDLYCAALLFVIMNVFQYIIIVLQVSTTISSSLDTFL